MASISSASCSSLVSARAGGGTATAAAAAEVAGTGGGRDTPRSIGCEIARFTVGRWAGAVIGAVRRGGSPGSGGPGNPPVCEPMAGFPRGLSPSAAKRAGRGTP